MRFRYRSVLVLLAIMILSAAYSLAKKPESTAVTDILPQPTETYVDNQLGFAFDYPAGWRLDSRPGDMAMVFSYTEDAVGPGGPDVPPDLTKIDFIAAQPNEPRRTIDLYVESARENPNGPGGRLVSEERLSLNGFPAARLAFTGGMGGDTETPVMVVEINGRMLFIAGYGDVTLFDAIVSTLRPAA